MRNTTRLATEYCSEKIPRNRLGMISVIPRKKVVIPRHSEVTEVLIPRLVMEGNGMKKISFTKQQQNNLTKLFVHKKSSFMTLIF